MKNNIWQPQSEK